MAATAEGLLIILLVLANGVFAMSEMAVVSVRKVRLARRAEEGDKGAAAALALAEEPNRFLSTVQVGITLIGTLAGAFGGATFSRELATLLATIPWLAPVADAIAFTVVVVIIAYLSLVLGELAPKRLALNNPEGIAALVAGPMTWLSVVAGPVVWLLSASTDLVVRLLGVRPSEEPPVTEDEIRLLIDKGTEAGIFEASEQDMVENVFRLGDRRISALVTPHTELVRLNLDATDQENWQRILASQHEFFPVYRDHLDNVLGLTCVRALWAQLVTGQEPDLAATLVEPLIVPESARALQVLERLKQADLPVALVIDEHGAIMGMVTLTDLLGGLVGPMTELTAPDHQAIVTRGDGSWLLDGLLPVDEFMDYFGIKTLPDEQVDYQTLGGFIMMRLGHIPQEGETFTWEGLTFEVVDMDELRVDKVLLTRQEKA